MISQTTSLREQISLSDIVHPILVHVRCKCSFFLRACRKDVPLQPRTQQALLNTKKGANPGDIYIYIFLCYRPRFVPNEDVLDFHISFERFDVCVIRHCIAK